MGKELGHSKQAGKKSDDIIKPDQSEKQYKQIKLENGLTALLVSDPETHSAAASLTVTSGSVSDPREVLGLSHFLEHVLSMGSVKFPGENELENFLNKHGGSYNGVTDLEQTQFEMDVDSPFLFDALDRFSQQFIAPLMEISSVEREIHAVYSEFESHEQNDAFRSNQLIAHTSQPGHYLNNRFIGGNFKSLGTTAKNSKTLRDLTKKLFDEKYIGPAMYLCVLGKEPLQKLEKWVNQCFKGVKERSLASSTAPPELSTVGATSKLRTVGSVWNQDVLYAQKAVGDEHKLEMAWMVPPIKHDERPEIYVLQLLNHVGNGSLKSTLKDKGLVKWVEARIGDYSYTRSSVGRLLIVSMGLTDSGLEKKYDIVEYVYQYLFLLKNAPPQQQEWVIEDYYQIKKIDFQYLDVDDDGIGSTPLYLTKFLSAAMIHTPVKYLLSAEYLKNPWGQEAITNFMKQLTPENMRISLISKAVDGPEFKTEPWYGTQYIEEKIPTDMKAKWSPTELVTFLKMPPRNKFIPSTSKPLRKLSNHYSQCLVNLPWFKLTHEWREEVSSAHFCIHTSGKSEDQVMLKIFEELLKDHLSETLYLGSIARLCTTIKREWNRFELKVTGYNEKMSEYISEIFEAFMTFDPDAKQFEFAKESILDDQSEIERNFVKHSDQLLKESLISNWSKDEKLKTPWKMHQKKFLDQINLPELKRFITTMRSKIFIEGDCKGDMTRTEAVQIGKAFTKAFPDVESRPLPLEEHLRKKKSILHIPRSAEVVKNVNAKECVTNSHTTVYFCIGQSDSEPMLNLFSSLVHATLTHRLRTQEMLGYNVDGRLNIFDDEVYGFFISIQSAKYDPSYLLARIHNFMIDFGKHLESLSHKIFEEHKDTVVRNYFHGNDITKNKLIKWYKRYFLSVESRRMIAICVRGSNTRKEGVSPGQQLQMNLSSSPRLTEIPERASSSSMNQEQKEKTPEVNQLSDHEESPTPDSRGKRKGPPASGNNAKPSKTNKSLNKV